MSEYIDEKEPPYDNDFRHLINNGWNALWNDCDVQKYYDHWFPQLNKIAEIVEEYPAQFYPIKRLPKGPFSLDIFPRGVRPVPKKRKNQYSNGEF
jgi:hypothetical protein